MTDERRSAPEFRSPRAGGVFIGLGLAIGAGVGIATGQPSLGMLIGMGIGGLIALLMWLRDRRR